MSNPSFISNAHPEYIDSLYKNYQQDPDLLDPSWRLFFEGFDFADRSGQNGQSTYSSNALEKELGVLKLIYAYRRRGHLLSTTNPIRTRVDRKPKLDLADYELSKDDLKETFQAGEAIGLKNATLQQILDRLNTIYAGNIGFEFMHIENQEQRHWLRTHIEQKNENDYYGLDLQKKKQILEKLNGAVIFERFLHTKYVGQKRFSLEGGETTIPAIDAMINSAAEYGVEEVVIGMAHRGRLNVLANIMGKTYEQIFNEFEGTAVPDLSFGDGDVKYHLGYSSIVKTPTGKDINLKLAPNPSHLESVNPVVEGFTRAKADIMYGSNFSKVLPILIHGDAAVAGQGVVYETAQMSRLKGYFTGGTLHFVINNQIGFTTDFDDARSSTYCTASGHMVQAPVFHVNGDDPEAVVFASELATAFRQKFQVDAFIDMVCYRKHGHNEGDDPKFTQPKMYEIISQHDDPRELYSKTLIARGSIEESLAKDLEQRFWNKLQERLDLVKENPLPYTYQEPEQAWRELKKLTTKEDFATSPITGISMEKVNEILEKIHQVPEGFTPLSKVNRLLKGAEKSLAENKLDWGMGEMLAYGSLLLEGKDVRLSGQDVRRGTFSHRHAVFYDSKDYSEYHRLNTLSDNQGTFRIYNSLLSEFAVLGFEYGYSMASPDNLVLWEAQFGDFFNGAQVIVDQYIAAGQSKWQRMSGLVMLLPHGYEGQGPEHSSARLERFLQMCAEYNMVVINSTTPANHFHALRRQLTWNFRKPLIVMSPKSLLRHPQCVSPREDFAGDKQFQEVLDDPFFTQNGNKQSVRKVLMCSGKIYYALSQYREEQNIKDVAIVRVEQLYPFPDQTVKSILDSYHQAKAIWVQEEPQNMGSWYFLAANHLEFFTGVVSRKSSASPATGFKKAHDAEELSIMERAFQ
jgi:2-oxoglutarate dehydrogenase E1 component